MHTATVILGAGWSSVAGMPLTKDLLTAEVFVASSSTERRFQSVWNGWHAWKEDYPDRSVEQFFQFVFETQFNAYAQWSHVVEFIEAVFATPPNGDWPSRHNLRYAQRLTRRTYCNSHSDFWRHTLARFQVDAVLTTNYDLLVERSLRHRRMRSGEPGIHYGGLPRPQVARGQALPFSVRDQQRLVELLGEVPLYKLHGSLNWLLQGNRIELFQDTRLAFRNGGQAAIVPPITEKTMPTWLCPVWEAAENALSRSTVWIVCGYSLPPYDLALNTFFRKAASHGNVERILVLDPLSAEIGYRWQSIAPNSETQCLPGLPKALAVEW
jgi:hypothetical protein